MSRAHSEHGHGQDGHCHGHGSEHEHGHGHDHRPSRSVAAQNKGRLAVVLALTTSFMVAEVVAGLWTGSLALLADAGHMLTDSAGVGLALLAVWFGERPPTPQRTFGFHRAEILAALANSVVLLVLSGFVLVEAYHRFRSPPLVHSGPMLLVAALGLLVNMAGLLVLRAGSSESLNLRGAYYELLSDALSSVGVIVAALVMWKTGWYYADPLISAAIGLFIVPRTWRLLKEAVHILLEGVPPGIDLEVVRSTLSQVPGVLTVHDLHVWALTSGMNAASLHAVLADGADFDTVGRALRAAAKASFDIEHITVQIERAGCAPHETHR
ncbi:MAG: cation diffusion facilitator family transporter [Polyangia bacterium]